MNPEEIEKFENDLNKSTDLNNEFNEYKKLNNIISKVKNIHLNDDYSESILFNFRNRINLKKTKSSFPKIRYAFTALFIAVAGYFIISNFNKEQPQEVNSCLLYTSDAADERSSVDLGCRRLIKKKNINRQLSSR